jgi:hypothetical protein
MVQQMQVMQNVQAAIQQQLADSQSAMGQLRAQNDVLVAERRDSLAAFAKLPEILEKLTGDRNKPRSLMDNKGLGKPYVLGSDDAEGKFRMWAIKVEDFVIGNFGEKFREAMQWAAEFEGSIDELSIDTAYGDAADATVAIENLTEMNSQFFSCLRNLTDGTPFTYVDNADHGNGFEAWRSLHKKYDPSTGGRKKVMLNALIRPDRATYEQMAGALERWKALRARYEKKRDQHGRRENLAESIAMNALENLVPKDLEQHLLMNHARLLNFDAYESEISLFVEAKTGAKMKVGHDFSKDDGGAVPMDVGSLIASVQNIKEISALVKGWGKGKGGNGGGGKFEGTCHNCGKKGHKSPDCWAAVGKGSGSGGKGGKEGKGGKGGKGGGKGRFEGTCNNCGKAGHKSADCWSKQDGKGGKGKGGKGKGGKGKQLARGSNGTKRAATKRLQTCVALRSLRWLRLAPLTFVPWRAAGSAATSTRAPR